VTVDPLRRALLASHGVHPGVRIEVDLDAPFGGPRIVRLGFARLAVARAVARSVLVRLDSAEPAREPG
jgi:Fe2+ transport system protein FeoA